jgi:hypothetical protein
MQNWAVGHDTLFSIEYLADMGARVAVQVDDLEVAIIAFSTIIGGSEVEPEGISAKPTAVHRVSKQDTELSTPDIRKVVLTSQGAAADPDGDRFT